MSTSAGIFHPIVSGTTEVVSEVGTESVFSPPPGPTTGGFWIHAAKVVAMSSSVAAIKWLCFICFCYLECDILLVCCFDLSKRVAKVPKVFRTTKYEHKLCRFCSCVVTVCKNYVFFFQHFAGW